MALKLKLDDNGNAVLKDGKPVYEYPDGKEFVADIDALHTKVTDQSKEIEKVRKRAKDAEDGLEVFEGIDPAQLDPFLDALEEIGGLEGLDKLKKGNVDVETIKKQMTDSYESKLGERDKVIGDKDGQIRKLLVSNGLAQSQFVNDNLLIPPDIVEATFGKNFKVEDGQVVAYLGENKILSRENPGELASIDEALSTIIDQYPMKDRIMKAQGGGSGAPGGGSPSSSGEKSLSRAAFDKLDPAERSTHIADGGTVSD